MKRVPNISIRSTFILMVLGIISIALLYWVETSKKFQKQNFYQEKLLAVQKTQSCFDHIKNVYFPNEIQMDNINDPNATGLIGSQFSEITSGRGELSTKLSTTNPNVAAMVVDMIKNSGVERGDVVALCYTGSFPALDIAVSSAIDVLGLEPILITSVTSSSWGANSPELTYNDIHRSLYDTGLLSFQPVASSIGGNQDVGRTLSLEGRQLCKKAISRNEIDLIDEGSLTKNIQKRMDYFKANASPVKLFINVGGGVASLGSHDNAETLPNGLQSKILLKHIPDKQGVVYEMAQKEIPIINFTNVRTLLNRYDLPRDPVPLPPIGSGTLFEAYQYDLTIVSLAFGVLLLLLGIIMYIDTKQNQLGTLIITKK